IEPLARLPRGARGGEWIAELEALAPMVLRRPERVLALLAELRGLGPIGPVSLQEVRDVLGDELATVRARRRGAARAVPGRVGRRAASGPRRPPRRALRPRLRGAARAGARPGLRRR